MQKIKLTFVIYEPSEHLQTLSLPTSSAKLTLWQKINKEPKAIVGLSLREENPDNV